MTIYFSRLSYKFSAFGKANNKHNPLIWLCIICEFVMNALSQTLNTLSHNVISIYFDHTVCTQCCSHQIDITYITYMCKQAKLNSCRSDSIESFSRIKGKKVLDLLLHHLSMFSTYLCLFVKNRCLWFRKT